jgi:toxin ParE1/3/4
MAHVTLTAPARDDLDAIWTYIAKDNLSAADRLIDEIHGRCAVYATQPLAATPADRFQVGLRFFVVGSYVVFYRPEDEGILVIRVLHGARNLEELLGTYLFFARSPSLADRLTACAHGS